MKRDLVVMVDALAGALLREREACEATGREGLGLVIEDAAEGLLALLDAAVAQGLDASPCGAETP